MVWPMIAMAAVSAVGSVVAASSASSQNKSQASWNRYNAQMGYSVDKSNIASQTMLGMFNASMQMKAANMNAAATTDMAAFNAGQVQSTVAYNNLLLEEEERLMWEAAGLDLQLLARQREQERGDIVGSQASSGITIGVGSHEDVVIDQRAQEMLDAFVIRHNADVGAAKIQNATAQNTWQGKAQVQKIMYEGEMGAAMMVNNARMAATGTVMETMLGASSATKSAEFARSSGMSGASQQFSSNQAQISNQLTQGLFSSAASAYGAYNSRAVPVPATGLSGPQGMGSLMDGSSTNPGNIMGSF